MARPPAALFPVESRALCTLVAPPEALHSVHLGAGGGGGTEAPGSALPPGGRVRRGLRGPGGEPLGLRTGSVVSGSPELGLARSVGSSGRRKPRTQHVSGYQEEACGAGGAWGAHGALGPATDCEGDFLIVDPIEEGEKVKAEISFVLCKDHVRSLQKEGLWPEAFSEVAEKQSNSRNRPPQPELPGETQSSEDDSSEDDSDLFVNTNRVQYQESEEESEEEA
ncbi:probable RNA-binding protein EIF1AD isoform X1 [Sarcophilus harrisii]|uniref:probable RNA-binding protein EIF1AD isoform X1 n=1 Tax=Sarcophilus harrisii TaxID=9305 RepID=UPI001301DAD0|nr:probable RNA-binding protein EIF1AD isoform X1 [Sarcophilus harrisii]